MDPKEHDNVNGQQDWTFGDPEMNCLCTPERERLEKHLRLGKIFRKIKGVLARTHDGLPVPG